MNWGEFGLKYKNTGITSKTFYGVTFKPKEVKDVPGYINDPGFVRVADSAKVTEPAKAAPAANKSANTNTQKAEVK